MLKDNFGDQVNVTGTASVEVSGEFEIQVVGGKLLHSKKGGDGHVDTPEKLEKVVTGIVEAIGKTAKNH